MPGITTPQSLIRLILCAGMNLCWLQAWSSYLISAGQGGNYSFLSGLIAYILPMLLSLIATERRLRIFWILLLQIPLGAVILYALLNWQAALRQPHSVGSWYQLVLLIVLSLLFMTLGALLPLKETSYFRICRIFDRGAFWLFLLALSKLWLSYKEDLQLAVPGPLPYLCFFILGAITLAESHQASAQRIGTPGRRGLLFWLSSTALFCGILAIVTLLYPQISRITKTTIEGIGTSGSVLLKPLEAVLHAIFSYSPAGLGKLPSQAKSADPALETVLRPDLFHHFSVAQYLFAAVLILVGLFFLGLILATLLRLLWTKGSNARPQLQRSGFIRIPVRLLKVIALLFRSAYNFLRRKSYTSEDCFRRLILWGTRSGVPPRQAETPHQYCRRLGSLFAELQPAIERIHHGYRQKHFQEIPLSAEDLSCMVGALKQLHHPRQWRQRILVILCDKAAQSS